MSSPEGTRLGKYRLLRHLATGGMAEIWLASIDNSVRPESGPFRFSCPTHAVIKVIAPDRAKDRTFVQMFLDEARVAATLHHPHIAQLYEVGCADGTYFHAMEYVHGENVRSAIERSLIVRQATPVAATVVLGRAVAAALHYAHERRGATGEPLDIVHRDVTPSNIMIGWDGVVKLVDFGVALAAGRAAQTRTGVVKGKLAYMSPEQCRGKKVDRRTDVFALGVVLYETSLQRRAFRADSEYQTMERIVRGDLPPPRKVMPDYPPALEAIVMRAMATDLEARYQTAAELGAALAELQVALGVADGAAAMAAHMRALYGEPPAPGHDVAPVSIGLVSVRAPSSPPAPGHDVAPELEDGTGDTRESPAALAAAAVPPPLMVPTGPMPVVSAPGPTAAMDAARPHQFPFGTQPAALSATVTGGAVASGAAVASGVAARSGTRAVTAPISSGSRAGYIAAGAVLAVGAAVAAIIVLTTGGATSPAPPPVGPSAAAVAAVVAPGVAPSASESQPASPPPVEAAAVPASSAPPAPSADEVTFTITSPGGDAEVSIDGTVRGTTPFELRMTRGDGRHRVEVRRSGFATYRASVRADRDQVIEANLVPRGARHAAAERKDSPGDAEEPMVKPMPGDPPSGGSASDLSTDRY